MKVQSILKNNLNSNILAKKQIFNQKPFNYAQNSSIQDAFYKNQIHFAGNSQTQKEAENIAKNVYSMIDNNLIVGALKTKNFKTELSKVNANNVIEFLNAYDELSPEESFVDAVYNEIMDFRSTQIKVTSGIYNNLKERASVSNLKPYSYLADEECKKAIKSGNKKEINYHFDTIRKEIENKEDENGQLKNYTPKEKETLRHHSINHLKGYAKTTEKVLTKFLDAQGWVERTVDKISNLWSSKNRETEVKKDIETYKNQINELQSLMGDSEKFDKKFIEIFGKPYDEVHIAAYEKTKNEYSDIMATKFINDKMSTQLGSILDNKDLRPETFLLNKGFVGYEKIEIKSKDTVYQEQEEKLAQFLSGENIEEGKHIINEIFIQKNIDLNKATSDEKYNVLYEIATHIKESIQNNLEKQLNGRTIEELEENFNSAYTAAYGTKNDIAKRVEEYNTSQERGAYILSCGIMGAAGMSLCFGASVLFPESVLLSSLSSALATSGASIGYYSSQALSSKNGLSVDEFKDILKCAGVDFAAVMSSNIIGIGLTSIEKGLKVTSQAGKALLQIGGQTLADIAIDSTAEYITVGKVTLEGVMFSIMFNSEGNVTSFRMMP